MTELLSGERQVAEALDGIRADHRARYEWAAARLAGQDVVDAGCGVGYGSKILAGAGCNVRAFDRSAPTIEFARQHYNHDERISYDVGELEHVRFPHGYGAVVCFEALEHIEQPDVALRHFAGMAPRLLVSVPNEAAFPYRGQTFHHRHYTATQLEALLNRNGWEVREWWGQEGSESPVAERVNGRTLIAVCEHVDVAHGGTAEKLPPPIKAPPQSVAIVAMGASSRSYLTLSAQVGNRRRLVDEVWAINAMAGTIQHDRVFHMDDMRLQELRAEAKPTSNVAGMCTWLREHRGPIYTSRAYPEFPGAVEYPLEQVMTATGHGYFNSTIAYAVAYAIAIGVRSIHLYGCDYSYPDQHKREKGRACLEFWVGLASARGIPITVASDSTLLDACVPEEEKFYGYDAYTLAVTLDDKGFHVAKTDKALPSAEEIERRYSHDPTKEETAPCASK